MIQLLRRLPSIVKSFTRESLAAYFGLPTLLFTERGDDGPILFHQAGSYLPLSYKLRGTIFWPRDRRIVRGLPRIPTTSDYTPEPYAVHNDRAMIDSLLDTEAVVEVIEPGLCVRLYHYRGLFHFATHTAHDGRTPLVGAGIDNVRELGISVASQAKRLCDTLYPKAYNLATLGYVPVFALLLPERETFVAADRPDLVLIDVIDPDYDFVDRLEKERIAEDYGLHVAALDGRIAPIGNPATYFSRMRALEMTATQTDGPGLIVKARGKDGRQIAARAEPAAVRAWPNTYSQSDLAAALGSVAEDFPDEPRDPAFAEELMLEYIGSRRRSVRWQVAEWLSNR